MYKIIIDHAPNQTDNDVVKDGLFAAHKDLIGEPDKHFSVF